jgi:hypothetical protein
VAAAYQGDDLATIAAACAEAGTDVGSLAEAEARALVRMGQGQVAFGHPLIRGAAYREATAGERRGAHRALGAALAGERRAWHLAAAAVGPNEQVAAELFLAPKTVEFHLRQIYRKLGVRSRPSSPPDSPGRRPRPSAVMPVRRIRPL